MKFRLAIPIVIIAQLIVGVGPALAHTLLVRSIPKANATLDRAPAQCARQGILPGSMSPGFGVSLRRTAAHTYQSSSLGQCCQVLTNRRSRYVQLLA